MSLTKYNDIYAMSLHHRKAWELLGRPTGMYPPDSTWTMGCPSVLMMFHRKSGELSYESELMRESMPPYYLLTSGHGAGAEHLFDSEAMYLKGDFRGASIACYKAEAAAAERGQTGNLICAGFLRLRLAVATGDRQGVSGGLQAMREAVTRSQDYFLLRTVGLCAGWLHATLGEGSLIPAWVGPEADPARDNHMYSFAKGSWYQVYGLSLLLSKNYQKVAGVFSHILESGVFSKHTLFSIYANVFLAAAYHGQDERKLAIAHIRAALDAALPDSVLMPFVENNAYIRPVLHALLRDRRVVGVRLILGLSEKWNEAVQGLDSVPPRYRLNARQLELVRLASEGKSFKDMARSTGLAHGTVRNLFAALYKRFDVKGEKELLELFRRAGLPIAQVQLDSFDSFKN
jgi:LuxR family maltose regulon positive regulatory protein